MIKFRLTLIFSLFVLFSYSQQWNWATVTAGGSSIDRNVLMAKGTAGDFFITGEFEQTQTFGTYTLIPVGYQDVYLAKYDQAGICLWAIQGGGIFSINSCLGISTDNAGNVYIGGNFTNQIIFGGYTLNIGTNGSSSFIAKFDNSGNCLFLNPIFSKGSTALKDLEQDQQGNYLITGYESDTTLFGNISSGVSNLNTDIYLAKFDAAGNFIWVKTAGGNDGDEGHKISSDAAGNIYLGGEFKQTATFGTQSVTSYGDFDLFVAKYDNSGNCIWVVGAGASGNDQLFGISNDANGNTYATGYYYPTPGPMMTTLPAHFGPFLLTDNGAGNMFILKLDSTGTFKWANKGGGSQTDQGYDISTDMNGNSYVTGSFFGNSLFGTLSLTSTGTGDAFIVKYNTYGTPLFAQKIGGTNSDFGKAVLSFSNGDCIVAGNFSTTLTVNTTPPSTLSAGSSIRVFIVKYSGGSVGINEPGTAGNRVELYPNPTTGQFTVSYFNEKSSICTFEVVNSLGQVLQSFTNESFAGLNDFQFNTLKLPFGSYVLKITDPMGTMYKKFIVSY